MRKGRVLYETRDCRSAGAGAQLWTFGCAAGQGTVVYQETVSPNEAYVESDADIVYYTLTVSQDAGYDITVRAESNFAFFDPVSYTLDWDGPITESDVLVQWTALGGGEPTEENQAVIADVTIAPGGELLSEQTINFVSGALEKVFDAVP